MQAVREGAITTIVAMACAGLLGITAVAAQGEISGPKGARPAQVVPLSPDALYDGWRASQILGDRVVSRQGDTTGIVRNIELGESGRIQALVVETVRSPDVPEFVYRVPWGKVRKDEFPDKVVAMRPPGSFKGFELSPPDRSEENPPKDFPVSRVIGDYARLETGLAYGHVSDVVFNSEGRMIAVLVVRDHALGGGTFAFGFPGRIGHWKPAWSYYGLPYVTTKQAEAAAIRVDPKLFRRDGA
jgi:sporulation protein YlmC with PRC-barrel domain